MLYWLCSCYMCLLTENLQKSKETLSQGKQFLRAAMPAWHNMPVNFSTCIYWINHIKKQTGIVTLSHNIINQISMQLYLQRYRKKKYSKILLNCKFFQRLRGFTLAKIILINNIKTCDKLELLRGLSGVWVRREIAQVASMTLRAFYLTSQCRIYTGKNWRCRCLKERTRVSFFFLFFPL
jgi:hypothetical protein